MSLQPKAQRGAKKQAGSQRPDVEENWAWDAENVRCGRVRRGRNIENDRMDVYYCKCYNNILKYICLFKKTEGAVFPLLVEAMEDGVADAFDAEFVDEADHGAGR